VKEPTVSGQLIEALARIRELEAALREAIEGHKVWESVYGSSATSRAHLAFLEAALGSPAETKCDCAGPVGPSGEHEPICSTMHPDYCHEHGGHLRDSPACDRARAKP